MIKLEARPSWTRFRVGTRVRVRDHVVDPDFPDLPLGGWVGEILTVCEGSSGNILVQWSSHTLKNVHPIYRGRCQLHDLCPDHMWLSEADLEADLGEPLSIHQPVSGNSTNRVGVLLEGYAVSRGR